MRSDSVFWWSQKLMGGAIGLASGWMLLAAAMAPSPQPVVSSESVTNIPISAAVDGREAARDMMRALRSSPLLCGHDGCVQRGNAIACAMYAPGHRPRRNGEDTPNIGNADEYAVQNPNWKWPQPG